MWEENTAEEELQIGKKLMWEMKRKKEEADEWDGVMLPEDEEDQAREFIVRFMSLALLSADIIRLG